MTRTSTPTASPGTSARVAARIRRKHERVIAEQPDETTRLRRAWSWVLAELKRQPHEIDHAIGEVTRLAEHLNGRGAQ